MRVAVLAHRAQQQRHAVRAAGERGGHERGAVRLGVEAVHLRSGHAVVSAIDVPDMLASPV